MYPLKLNINESQYEVLVDSHITLLEFLREKTGLTGTKRGCEQGACGSCTVLVDGKPVLSCITPALKCEGAKILTIEGVSKKGVLHPLQQFFIDKGAVQCGFCTPGMIMTALAFINEKPKANRQEIKKSLSGNLCRCTGYKKIIDAVSATLQEK